MNRSNSVWFFSFSGWV